MNLLDEFPPLIGMLRPRGLDVQWKDVERCLRMLDAGGGVDVEPEYQRGHVWTHQQRVAYLEHVLRGGLGARQMWWNEYPDGRVELVDGLQRLTAVRMFMRGEITVFPGWHGRACGWTAGRMRIPLHAFMRWDINCLASRADALRWYLQINTAGTAHAEDEIARVRSLLTAEESADDCDLDLTMREV